VFLLPLYYLGWTSINSIKESARQTAIVEFKFQAQSLASAISSILGAIPQISDGVATTVYPMGKTPQEAETVLVGFRHSSPLIKRIALVATDGTEIAASDCGRQPRDWSGTKLWRAIKSAESPCFIKHVETGEAPFVVFVNPVLSADGSTRILISEIDLLGIWQSIDELRFGKTGTVELYIDDYPLAADNCMSVVAGVAEKRKWILDAIGDRLASPQASSEAGVFFASKRIEFIGISVLIRKKAVEVFEKSRHIQSLWLWGLLICTATVFVSSVFLPRIITRPLKQLSIRARTIAQGNYEAEPLKSRSDDIGILFEDFNDMMRRIKEIRMLEQRATVGDAVERIAHDLGSPLTAMKTLIAVIEKEPGDASCLSDFLSIVPAEIERLERLVASIREYSRDPSLNKTLIDIKILIERIILTNRPLARKNGIALTAEHTADNYLIHADQDHLQRVLLNLLNNAMNALPEKGEVRFVVENRTLGDDIAGISITISDNGSGVPENLVANLFRPFVSGRKDGLGLGLAICRSLIHCHNGTITYSKNDAGGADFVIWLPQEPEE
jgi:signal transduction histidine kinase